MRFNCQSCAAKYQIADEKVAGKTVRMKCRKCGVMIQVRPLPNGEAEHVPEAQGRAGSSESHAPSLVPGSVPAESLAPQPSLPQPSLPQPSLPAPTAPVVPPRPPGLPPLAAKSLPPLPGGPTSIGTRPPALPRPSVPPLPVSGGPIGARPVLPSPGVIPGPMPVPQVPGLPLIPALAVPANPAPLPQRGVATMPSAPSSPGEPAPSAVGSVPPPSFSDPFVLTRVKAEAGPLPGLPEVPRRDSTDPLGGFISQLPPEPPAAAAAEAPAAAIADPMTELLDPARAALAAQLPVTPFAEPAISPALPPSPVELSAPIGVAGSLEPSTLPAPTEPSAGVPLAAPSSEESVVAVASLPAEPSVPGADPTATMPLDMDALAAAAVSAPPPAAASPFDAAFGTPLPSSGALPGALHDGPSASAVQPRDGIERLSDFPEANDSSADVGDRDRRKRPRGIHPMAWGLIAMCAALGGVAAWIFLSPGPSAPGTTASTATVAATGAATVKAADEVKANNSDAAAKSGTAAAPTGQAAVAPGADVAAGAPGGAAAGSPGAGIAPIGGSSGASAAVAEKGDKPAKAEKPCDPKTDPLCSAVGGPDAPGGSGQRGDSGAGLSPEQISSVVARNRGGVQRGCLPLVQSGAVKVNVTLTVGPSGNVSSVSTSGGGGNGGVVSCIRSKVSGWHFPSSGGTTSVSVPFQLIAQQ